MEPFPSVFFTPKSFLIFLLASIIFFLLEVNFKKEDRSFYTKTSPFLMYLYEKIFIKVGLSASSSVYCMYLSFSLVFLSSSTSVMLSEINSYIEPMKTLSLALSCAPSTHKKKKKEEENRSTAPIIV